MNDEKLLILKMLEDGKINSKEAIDLLNALDDSQNSSDTSGTKPKNFTKVLDGLGSNLAESISDSIASLVNNIKNIDLGPSSGEFKLLEKNITEDIALMDSPNIDISTLNGFINLEPVDSNKLMIKLEASYRGEENIDIEDLYKLSLENNTIKFEPSLRAKNTSMSLNILLPKKRYRSSSLESKNSAISIKDLDMDSLKITTTNGNVRMANMSLGDGTVKTSNAKVNIDNIRGNKLDILTSNGTVELARLYEKFIYAKTTNGNIKADKLEAFNIILNTTNGNISTKDTSSNLLDLSSNNGSIASRLPKNRELQCELSTSFGGLKLDRDDFIYDTKKLDKSNQKLVVGRTKNYNSSSDRTDLVASTSHGSIVVESY